MDINDLRYIVEVNRASSISKAASRLFISQPNLSKAITNLEKEVGIEIFKRTPQGVITTDEGKNFINYAVTLLSQFDEFESMFKSDQKNQIKFSVSMPRATYISVALANFINKIDEHIDISINIRETNSIDTIQNVFKGESEIGIIRYQTSTEAYFLNLLNKYNLNKELLFQYKLKLLMSKDHPLADHDIIYYHELQNYTEIVHGDLFSPNICYDEINPNVKGKINRRIYVYERGSQFEILKRLKTSYMWVSPLPEDVLEQNGLITVECDLANHDNKDVIIYSNKHQKTKYEMEFIKEIQQTFKKSI